MDLDTGIDRLDRDGPQIEQPLGRRADKYDGPLQGISRFPFVQNVRGGNVGEAAPQATVGNDHLPRTVGGNELLPEPESLQHLAVADLCRLHRDLVDQQETPCHFQRKRGIEPVLIAYDHRRTPDNAIRIRLQRKEAAEPRGLLQYSDIARIAAHIVHRQPADDVRLGQHQRLRQLTDTLLAAGVENVAKHDITIAQSLCQHCVIVEQAQMLAKYCRQLGIAFPCLQQALQHQLAAVALGLGEYDIETDHRRPLREQVVDQGSDLVTRPWPVTFCLETLFVDVDDDDAAICRLFMQGRFQPQIVDEGVETLHALAHQGQLGQLGPQYPQHQQQADKRGIEFLPECPPGHLVAALP